MRLELADGLELRDDYVDQHGQEGPMLLVDMKSGVGYGASDVDPDWLDRLGEAGNRGEFTREKCDAFNLWFNPHGFISVPGCEARAKPYVPLSVVVRTHVDWEDDVLGVMGY